MTVAVRSASLCAAFIFAVCSGSAQAQEITETVAVCAACHGEDGKPIDTATPIIWGQMEGYLYLQLRDFKSGARKHEQMNAVVADLTKENLKALAAHFASQPWPDLQQPSAPKAVADQAIAANISVGCTGCHLGEYQGDSTVPRLAGQQGDYLDKTMKDFRARTRGNNPGMSDLMNAALPEDLTALAVYTAGLQLQGGNRNNSR